MDRRRGRTPCPSRGRNRGNFHHAPSSELDVADALAFAKSHGRFPPIGGMDLRYARPVSGGSGIILGVLAARVYGRRRYVDHARLSGVRGSRPCAPASRRICDRAASPTTSAPVSSLALDVDPSPTTSATFSRLALDLDSSTATSAPVSRLALDMEATPTTTAPVPRLSLALDASPNTSAPASRLDLEMDASPMLSRQSRAQL